VHPFTRASIAIVSLALGVLSIARQATADEALELYNRGVALADEERYSEAAAAFTRAYEKKPSWKILFNIGQCEAASGRYGVALEAFEQYTLEGGDDIPFDRRDYVSEELRRLQPLVGSVSIDAPDKTVVMIDGHVRATIPLKGPLRVAAGSHVVMLMLEDEILFDDAVKIAGGMTTEITAGSPAPVPEVQPEPEAEIPPEPEAEIPPGPEAGIPPKPEAKADDGRPLWTGGWVMVGIGAGLLAAGGITGSLALKTGKELESDYPDGVPQDKKGEIDSMDNLAITTNVLLGVGGAAAVAGAIMLIVDAGSEEEASVALVPVGGGSCAGLALEGRF
jgi:hypothetical protein